MSKAKKTFAVLLTLLVLAAALAMTASAAWVNYNKELPAWQGNTNLCSGTKSTSSAYLGNQCTMVGNNNEYYIAYYKSYAPNEQTCTTATDYRQYATTAAPKYAGSGWSATVKTFGRARYYGGGMTIVQGSVDYNYI